MQDYSRPLGDTIRSARLRMGYTQKQLADLIDVDERTIASIEKYQANTTMDILYPLIRALKVNPQDIFNHEMGKESPAHYQLRLLLGNCSEEEAATLVSVCESVLNALRNQNAILIEQK